MTKYDRRLIFLFSFFLLIFTGVCQAAFVDNGDGTVTDTESGLMWQQATAPSVEITNTYSWNGANWYVGNLSLGGTEGNEYSDWRLPTLSELRNNLRNCNLGGLLIDTSFFPDTERFGAYWTSTAHSYSTYVAYTVSFGVCSQGGASINAGVYVRAVRNANTKLEVNSTPQNLPAAALMNSDDYGHIEFYTPISENSVRTYIISHGWNRNDNDVETPEWMRTLAQKIVEYHSQLPEPENVNILLWNWQEKAKTDQSEFVTNLSSENIILNFDFFSLLPILDYSPAAEDAIKQILFRAPFAETKESGQALAKKLNELEILKNGTVIHFLGHSLGSEVITYAVDSLDDEIKESVEQMTFFDAPFYFEPPGKGSLLSDLKSNYNIFVDNYASQLGFFYKDADVNTNIGFKRLEFFEGHSYSYDWYTKSILNFTEGLLGDTTYPSYDVEYGFTFSQNTNSNYLFYSQHPNYQQWELLEGFWDITKQAFVDSYEFLEGSAIFATGVAAKLSAETIAEINQLAQSTGMIINVIEAKTFDVSAEALEFVVNEANHAYFDLSLMSIVMQIASESIISTQLTITDEIKAIRFDYDYLTSEGGSVLEAFIEDKLVLLVNCDELIDKGVQSSSWIDVSYLSGKTINFSIRISNPDDNMHSKISIDNIIMADFITPNGYDNDGDGFTENNGDCDDSDSSISPAAEEICGDGIDNDCNGEIDESCIVFGDLDGDGDIDRNDITIINSNRNQPASICPECDIDGDGTITVLDARKLMMLCDCPRCVCP